MLEIGTQAPSFRLPECEGGVVSLEDFAQAPALLIMFICNHCPFVKHISSELSRFAREYRDKGLAIVAVNSNDVATHPQDSPEHMGREKRQQGYVFPYLYDESQEVAKAYQAACTPDFFLFDGQRRLYYRGQFDPSRPGNGLPVDGLDLRRAADSALGGEPAPHKQSPSIGCNIKWKEGNEPHYFKP